MQTTLEVYSLFDNKTESYGIPIFFKNIHEAKADLAGAIQHWNQAGTPTKQQLNPVNYDLFHIGKYDSTNGKIKTKENPEHICNLRQLTQKEPA